MKRLASTEPAQPETQQFEAVAPDSTQALSKGFPIVGIGASAGGLAAFEAFLSAMPAVTEKGIAFVLVQHLSPDHKSLLTELVKRYASMQVYEVEDGMEVKPNCVYIIPPNRDMALLSGKLQLLEPTPRSTGLRLPIDFFFRSLAADQRERAICIVLSGTGSDGSLGLRAVKGEGGMAMAQTPESTEFDGMPRSAIDTGLVDYILPAEEMPAQLIAYVDQFLGSGVRRVQLVPEQFQDVLAKICVLLRAQTGRDFSQYKENTIIRRMERRMALHQIARASDYLRYLRQHSEEVDALFHDLLIGVTSFFRDSEVFAALKSIGIPRLFEGLPPGSAIRVWVCSCSTGEEAYSIAILIQEHIETLRQPFNVQIFATDIDRRAMDLARAGVFSASAVADISAERLTRFFTEEPDGSYRIRKAVRDVLIFSEQDVVKDPPFSKLSLISCRNLLIYLNPHLQKRLIPLFHYALKPGGILLLGSSETIGDRPGLFEALDRKAKLYRRRQEESGAAPHALSGTAASNRESRNRFTPPKGTEREAKLNLRELTEQTLLRHFSQAAVLTDSHGEILYFHGRTGNYLEPSPGDASANILKMAREGLRRSLTSALHRAASKKEPVLVNDIRIKATGHHISVDLTILPVGASAAPALFLVILEEKNNTKLAPQADKGSAAAEGAAEFERRAVAFEQELRTKDEYIRTIIEEMETSSEELKSSNEELQSVNEEMQSTNEELETSKEELQSVNEELATVNAELQQKVASLSRLNNDMNNLLAGTGVGTLFVDHQLRIARFTPSITQVINLIQSDVGRPLAHIVSNLVGYDHLISDVQDVLDTLIPLEAETQSKAGGWFLLGIRPYRTLDNIIEGAVITFVNITERKIAEQKLQESERFRNAMEIETVGIVFYKIDGPMLFANHAFLRICGYGQNDLHAGRIRWDVMTPAEWMPLFKQSINDLNASGRAFPHERQYIRKDGSRRWALFASHRIANGEAVEYIIDITQAKEVEQKLRETQEKYRRLLEAQEQ